MIPITRKELYLNKIVGNNDYETPEKPITIEEFFFAEILGEAVQAPEPLTRYQIYLAKIAGRNIEIPYPETRLEYFLAKAAGMDVETPAPITREEIFWSNYSAIVDFEVEGVPPLTYKAIEGTLTNYRIYGNTVDGESVGDRTGNLFDMKTFAETAYQQNATVNYSENSLIFTATQTDAYVNQVYSQVTVPVALRSSCINVQPLTTYTISMNAPYKCFISWINDSFDPVAKYTKIPNNQTSYTFTTPSNCTKLLIRLGKDVTNIGDTFTISNIMLNAGSTPLPYEPYGYKVPVTISNGTDTLTTPIYLPEQIRKVGDEAEYIDYGEQKQHRVRKNLFDKNSYKVSGYVSDNGTIIISGSVEISTFDYIKVTAQKLYSFKAFSSTTPSEYQRTVRIAYYDKNKNYLSRIVKSGAGLEGFSFETPVNCQYIRLSIDENLFDNMLVKGNLIPIEYEPFIENTEVDVTLPALPTIAGTNVLTVGTAVQPSKVYIKGEKGRD